MAGNRRNIVSIVNQLLIIGCMLIVLSVDISFSQEESEESITVQGFVQNSGLEKNQYLKKKYDLWNIGNVLMADMENQYLLKSSKDLSGYIGDFCKITGQLVENKSYNDYPIINIDSIDRIDFHPDYTEQEAKIIALTQLLFRNEVIDTVQGYLNRNDRLSPGSFNDYIIKADKAVMFTGGESGAKYEMISEFTVYYLDLNMMYDFEKYLRAGKKIKIEGYLTSGDAHSLIMTVMKILE